MTQLPTFFLRNYMTKHLSDSWMIESGFVDEEKKKAKIQAWWTSKKIKDLDLKVTSSFLSPSSLR